MFFQSGAVFQSQQKKKHTTPLFQENSVLRYTSIFKINFKLETLNSDSTFKLLIYHYNSNNDLMLLQTNGIVNHYKQLIYPLNLQEQSLASTAAAAVAAETYT